ncbi:MAG TPA: tetratricopeptide repeat protein, partial [Candidatus Krumholzibacteria bacterium]|nr:tetratricopeptide repeat protein [Candidatus Krumholzibacteria bacterium]
VMFAAALLYLAVRKHVLGSSLVSYHRFTQGAEQAVALSFSILGHYVYKLVFPFRLNAESDFPPPAHLWNVYAIIGIGIFAGVCYATYRWRRHSAMVFGVAVIGLGLAPVLNVVPINQILAERFLYFPSLGFCLLLALAAVSLRRRWRLATTIMVALLLAAYSVRTVVGTRDWKDDLTLFTRTVALSGNNARARASLGGSLYNLGRYDDALNQYHFAVRLNPSYALGWSGLARTEGKLGHMQEALNDMQRAIDIEPESATYYHSLGLLQFQARDYMSAIGSFRTALQLRPRHLQARFNLGLALYQIGDFGGAVREFTALENKDTDFPNAYFFTAESEVRRGNADAAVEAARHFLAVHTGDDALTTRARQIVASGGTP